MAFIAPIFMELPVPLKHYVEICIYRFPTKPVKKYEEALGRSSFTSLRKAWQLLCPEILDTFLQRRPVPDFMKRPPPQKKRFNLWY